MSSERARPEGGIEQHLDAPVARCEQRLERLLGAIEADGVADQLGIQDPAAREGSPRDGLEPGDEAAQQLPRPGPERMQRGGVLHARLTPHEDGVVAPERAALG